ncbi:DsrE family protein [Sphingobium sp. UBA5915]|uniref:DsrE family protein n=1 Tax=Sphingobium sp. UBA5915 TaxID=1947530 RepID=UPI0025EF7A99|nr:DsrE family protein [Sphingobium sp. UBA5915]
MAEVANRPAATDDMRALFEITGEARGPKGVNRSLDRVARYLNLLASSGVTAKPGDIKVIIHGPATSLILRDEAYHQRFKSTNPNTPLIAALVQAGVEIHVCGQAVAGQKIAREDINPAVTVDLSAMTTLVLLQRQGWPLVSD